MTSSFKTSDARYEFDIDGRTLYLPPLNKQTVESITALALIDDRMEQMFQFRQIAASEVFERLPWWNRLFLKNRASRLVQDLSIIQIGHLYKGWSGMNLGNSSSSSD